LEDCYSKGYVNGGNGGAGGEGAAGGKNLGVDGSAAGGAGDANAASACFETGSCFNDKGKENTGQRTIQIPFFLFLYFISVSLIFTIMGIL
jgi:hypothetical protein